MHIVQTNENTAKEKENIYKIKDLIHTIRGKQVLLDSDVARLYQYETKNINKAMKRNIDRFPDDFCFQLTIKELQAMWFQNGTTYEETNAKYRSEKYLPYVYTEQGVSMLSGLLKNDIAVQVSISIMRAFVEMRKFMSNHANMFHRLTTVEYKMLEHDKKFNQNFNELQKNEEAEFTQKIFFEGQIFDAYSLIIDIIKSAKEKILIIDNYIDESVLKILSKKNKKVEVIILTLPNSKLMKLDITKFNKQYPTLKVARTNKFHDRFMIIDNKDIYHFGASLKDLEKKCFAINKMQDMSIVEYIKNK